ncbi:glutamate-1-semialdehyde 2,1-aminomutase [Bradyrhizobium shewense]|uniref:Glutamate-1-semialdehyde 2,1-aminomutase n=1 Tax=Bradyrhizobium shewense TaxID=1761772 RepID=A0A1C3XKV1_9BRAD|nr:MULTISPECIES: aspartate aminotransferase family protein [Bradyrhizobium]PPQ14718.1 aspartate aminotransferase family protein [Bradyrhizobium sp. AC87j1]SCB52921.1 glutamate-1-semialdehyde 2,1-aminomutase [Bradyrhizobium shewense]
MNKSLQLDPKNVESDIDAAVTAARASYVRANPKSLEAFERAAEYLPGGTTRSGLFNSPFPVFIARGQDAYIWDLDGKRYVDALSEFTAGLLGHSNPVVLGTIRQALDNGLSLGGQIEDEARFARLIVDRFPSIKKVRFTNSGTEANVSAIAAALHYTGRSKVMVFEGAYHGGSLNFPVNGPSPLNARLDLVQTPYNDVEAVRATIRRQGEKLGVVIVEPMLGAGGSIPADREFLAALREETARIGAVLIFDEIQTSRLAPNGMQGYWGITPDMTTLGKYLAGGLSIGAFGGREDIMAQFDPRKPASLVLSGTFNNNSLGMRVGAAVLSEVATEEAISQLSVRGNDLRRRLNGTLEGAGVAGQFTGFGSILAIHFVMGSLRNANDAVTSHPSLRELFYLHMLEEGIWIARRGMMALSLALSHDDLDKVESAVDSFADRWGDILPRR